MKALPSPHRMKTARGGIFVGNSDGLLTPLPRERYVPSATPRHRSSRVPHQRRAVQWDLATPRRTGMQRRLHGASLDNVRASLCSDGSLRHARSLGGKTGTVPTRIVLTMRGVRRGEGSLSHVYNHIRYF